MDRAQVVESLSRYFRGRRDIVAAYLFGSVARDRAGKHSDVDVGLILGSRAPRQLADLLPLQTTQDDLGALLHRAVDVVPMNGASPDLLHRILRDGILVHESDHHRRIEFEVRARSEYFDLLPILERYRRTVLGSI